MKNVGRKQIEGFGNLIQEKIAIPVPGEDGIDENRMQKDSYSKGLKYEDYVYISLSAQYTNRYHAEGLNACCTFLKAIHSLIPKNYDIPPYLVVFIKYRPFIYDTRYIFYKPTLCLNVFID